MSISTFCPQLIELLEARELVGKSGKALDISSLSTVHTLCTLQRLLEVVKPSRTLETGFSLGASTLLFASYHQTAKHEPETHVAIDPNQLEGADSAGLLALERAGLSKFVSYRDAYSSRELPKLLEAGNTFGMIYIDGSHLFEDVFVDAYFGAQLLSPGGVMAFDDSANAHVAKVVRFLRTNMRDHLAEVDLLTYRDGHRLRYRIARALNHVQLTAFRRIGRPVRAWNAKFHRF
jgi:predicted O-methyltransferase YrrM